MFLLRRFVARGWRRHRQRRGRSHRHRKVHRSVRKDSRLQILDGRKASVWIQHRGLPTETMEGETGQENRLRLRILAQRLL